MIIATDIVTAARAECGKPYIWAAKGPNAFDCSGLVSYVLEKLGIAEVPDGSYNLLAWAKRLGGRVVTLDEARGMPGVLLFRRNEGTKQVEHVAFTDGDNNTIEARGTKWGVGVWAWDGNRRWDEAVTVPGVHYGRSES